MELHKMWGIWEGTVYNDSLSEDTANIIETYVRDGFVDFRQVPRLIDDEGKDTILLNMSPVINDCMYRNMYRYRKLVCTDFDEMIVPRMHDTYADMMSTIQKVQPQNQPPTSYMFRNIYYFLDLKSAMPEPKELMTQPYLKSLEPSEYGYSVKSITDPMGCKDLQNHLCWSTASKFKHAQWLLDVNTQSWG